MSSSPAPADPCATYPRAMYRAGGTELIWGKPIETRAAASLEEEEEALAHGWRFHPLDCEDEQPLISVEIPQVVKRGRPRKMEA